MISLDNEKNLIKFKQFKIIKPVNFSRAYRFLMETIEDSKAVVAVKGDWDVDGVLAAKQFYNFYRDIPKKVNTSVHFGKTKDHGISNETIDYVIENKVTHLIIVDSSSNNMSELVTLNNYGVKVLIVDHHICNYNYDDYPDNCVIINNQLEGNEVLRHISAGMLSYIVVSWARKHYGISVSSEDLVFAYATLVSDGCLLSDEYIKPIILGIRDLTNIPLEIRVFMSQYSKLGRNFISYNFANYINDLTRVSDEDTLKKLFFSELSYERKKLLVDKIVEDQRFRKKQVDESMRYIEDFSVDLGGIILADLDKLPNDIMLSEDYIKSSTGLFAIKLCILQGKTTIAYKYNGNGMFKASGRSLLCDINFEELCNVLDFEGGGHPGAFGFTFSQLDLANLVNYCKSITKVKPELVYTTIDFSSFREENIKEVFQVISDYNEIASHTVHPIYLELELKTSDSKRKEIGKMVQYEFNGFTVKDLMAKTKYGDTILINPQFKEDCVGFVL